MTALHFVFPIHEFRHPIWFPALSLISHPPPFHSFYSSLISPFHCCLYTLSNVTRGTSVAFAWLESDDHLTILTVAFNNLWLLLSFRDLVQSRSTLSQPCTISFNSLSTLYNLVQLSLSLVQSRSTLSQPCTISFNSLSTLYNLVQLSLSQPCTISFNSLSQPCTISFNSLSQPCTISFNSLSAHDVGLAFF
jgi:hypothetical protein